MCKTRISISALKREVHFNSFLRQLQSKSAKINGSDVRVSFNTITRSISLWRKKAKTVIDSSRM